MRPLHWLSLDGLGVSSPFDPTFQHVTSPVFSPMVLGALRLLFAVYALTTTIVTLIYSSVVFHDADTYFTYFTDLSYIGLVAYFWASGVQTIAFVLHRRKSYPLQTWPWFLQLLHVLLYSTVVVFPILVTIVFWSLLSSSTTFQTAYSAWSNVSRHILNTVFVLFEIFLTHGGPSPWTHLPFLILILASYLGVAYITHATQGFYTYDFLDPSTEHGLLAAYIVGIAVGCCVVFTAVYGACTLRRRISPRYETSEDLLDTEPLEEWQDVAEPKDSTASNV